MMIEIRHLRLVVALHETGGATAAAARLGVSQSAVSHQLREIETRLGVPVCVRAGKRLVLTPAGTRLLASARTVLPELEQVPRDVRRLHEGQGGLLRVAAQCHTGYRWLPPVVRAFAARHPGVELEVEVQHTGRLVDALLEGVLDLALLTDTVRDRRLHVRHLGSDEHAAIVARDHAWATRAFITPAELASENLLLYSASPSESFTVREILRPAGVRPVRVRFVQLTEAILEMVKAGLGVTVMPTWSIQSALADGELRSVRITRGGVHREWAAATLQGAADPPYVEGFLELVRQTIRGLAHDGERTAAGAAAPVRHAAVRRRARRK